MIRTPRATRESYSAVADEYYDESLHPTCASLRTASLAVLIPWLGATPAGLRILEVGAGRSVLLDWDSAGILHFGRYVATDESAAMLEYSEPAIALGAELEVATATGLPFSDRSFDTMVCSLGDPYNTLAFWIEARRVLTPGGEVLFTSPSHAWAHAYRGISGSPPHKAVFVSRDGSRHEMPSVVRNLAEQTALLASAALEVLDVRHVALCDLPEPVAPKLVMVLPASEPVLFAVRARRAT